MVFSKKNSNAAFDEKNMIMGEKQGDNFGIKLCIVSDVDGNKIKGI